MINIVNDARARCVSLHDRMAAYSSGILTGFVRAMVVVSHSRKLCCQVLCKLSFVLLRKLCCQVQCELSFLCKRGKRNVDLMRQF